jgi:hypothetical protein
MTTTLPRRTASLTVLAVTAASGVALSGAVASAHDAPRAHTSLSVRTLRGVINPGSGDTVRGQLWASDHHNAGRRIELRANPVGGDGWAKVARHRSNHNGIARFEVTPTATTRYQLVFAGNKKQAPSHSGVVTVRVNNSTSLVETVGTKSIDPGQSDTVNGVLSLDGSGLAGQTVRLLGAPLKQHLAYISSGVTGADGSVQFTVAPATSSHYALVFKKTDTYAGTRSAQSLVRVRMPSSLSIRARANHKKGMELISGQLRGSGNGLAHRRITLMTRPSGSEVWATASKEFTKRHGVVTFKLPAPTTSTDYQLSFPGGPVYDGCQSGVVTVTVA